MTFPLDFDLLMIEVCTFIQKKNKKTKKRQKKTKKKTKKRRQKKQKKMQRYVCVSYFTPSIFCCCWVHHWGFGEIFMRDELCESSLRSFFPWIMDDMYWI